MLQLVQKRTGDLIHTNFMELYKSFKDVLRQPPCINFNISKYQGLCAFVSTYYIDNTFSNVTLKPFFVDS